jgi:hypothetical protein
MKITERRSVKYRKVQYCNLPVRSHTNKIYTNILWYVHIKNTPNNECHKINLYVLCKCINAYIKGSSSVTTFSTAHAEFFLFSANRKNFRFLIRHLVEKIYFRCFYILISIAMHPKF